ncbi:hypothetical protein HAX54_023525 [Datura stramonium]|uniref:Uncharacterized protein n=1 Tax=Datura stramonium TaxID=4076 RepID=A0ABS8UWM9_DATST|nr:hypothetical protein [Datura stramonium]
MSQPSSPSKPTETPTPLIPTETIDVSADEVTDRVTTEEPGCMSPSLILGGEFIVQSLEQMAQGETMVETLSPIHILIDLPSSPKCDGTLEELIILENIAASEENEDEQPLSWKVMDEALKENQIRTNKRRKLKKRAVKEDDKIQPDVILDQVYDEITKDIDDDVSICVLMKRGKAPNPKKTEKSQGPHIKGPDTSSKPYQQRDSSFCLTREERQEILKSQKILKIQSEIERITGLLAQRDAKIVCLKAAPIEEPGLVAALRQENDDLKAEVKDLTCKLLQTHETAN